MKIKKFEIQVEKAPCVAFYFLESTLKQPYQEILNDAVGSGVNYSYITIALEEPYLVLYFEEYKLQDIEEFIYIFQFIKTYVSDDFNKMEFISGRFTSLPNNIG